MTDVPEQVPPFPRIPLIVAPGEGPGDDRVAGLAVVSRLLAEEVVVEEKLDGANLSISLGAHGWPVAMSRSGKTHGDRGGQLGRANAWAAERGEALGRLLRPGEVLYGEWLARTHTVVYDALPDWLIVLDLWSEATGFVSVAARDRRCREAGLATPPVLFAGRLGGLERLEALHGRSRFGSDAAEGLVVRLESTEGLELRAKWLAPGFERKSDEAWVGDARMNALRRPAVARSGLEAAASGALDRTWATSGTAWNHKSKPGDGRGGESCS